MEELFRSGSIDQNRSSINWPLAKALQRHGDAETGFKLYWFIFLLRFNIYNSCLVRFFAKKAVSSQQGDTETRRPGNQSPLRSSTMKHLTHLIGDAIIHLFFPPMPCRFSFLILAHHPAFGSPSFPSFPYQPALLYQPTLTPHISLDQNPPKERLLSFLATGNAFRVYRVQGSGFRV